MQLFFCTQCSGSRPCFLMGKEIAPEFCPEDLEYKAKWVDASGGLLAKAIEGVLNLADGEDD